MTSFLSPEGYYTLNVRRKAIVYYSLDPFFVMIIIKCADNYLLECDIL
jgi:hypothetical protein